MPFQSDTETATIIVPSTITKKLTTDAMDDEWIVLRRLREELSLRSERSDYGIYDVRPQNRAGTY